ncbi:prevent-host-death family protein, partial [Candidatus Electrothrix marina]
SRTALTRVSLSPLGSPSGSFDFHQRTGYHRVIKTIITKYERGTMTTISVAAAKSRFSELIAKSSYARERFIITKRNKPVAALVSLEDLQIIEQHEERQGLASIVGKWKGFEEVEEQIGDLSGLRKDTGTRKNVSL